MYENHCTFISILIKINVWIREINTTYKILINHVVIIHILFTNSINFIIHVGINILYFENIN